jgi:hypothetical protein
MSSGWTELCHSIPLCTFTVGPAGKSLPDVKEKGGPYRECPPSSRKSSSSLPSTPHPSSHPQTNFLLSDPFLKVSYKEISLRQMLVLR